MHLPERPRTVQQSSVELRRKAPEGAIVPTGKPMAMNMGREVNGLV
jgi:hypothetical protein